MLYLFLLQLWILFYCLFLLWQFFISETQTIVFLPYNLLSCEFYHQIFSSFHVLLQIIRPVLFIIIREWNSCIILVNRITANKFYNYIFTKSVVSLSLIAKCSLVTWHKYHSFNKLTPWSWLMIWFAHFSVFCFIVATWTASIMDGLNDVNLYNY